LGTSQELRGWLCSAMVSGVNSPTYLINSMVRPWVSTRINVLSYRTWISRAWKPLGFSQPLSSRQAQPQDGSTLLRTGLPEDFFRLSRSQLGAFIPPLFSPSAASTDRSVTHFPGRLLPLSHSTGRSTGRPAPRPSGPGDTSPPNRLPRRASRPRILSAVSRQFVGPHQQRGTRAGRLPTI